MLRVPTLSLVLAALVAVALAYPGGSPDLPGICASMKPNHDVPPMRLPPPFTIEVNNDRYYPQEILRVAIRGVNNFRFKGFSIQARRVDTRLNQTEPLGFFTPIMGTKNICQEKNGNGLTHTEGEGGSDDPKNLLELDWMAPNTAQGHIQFRVTVVSTYATYWVSERSATIRDPADNRPIPTERPPKPVTPAVEMDFNTDECGKSRGCYREPKGCDAMECEGIVMWEFKGDTVSFQMSGDTDGWVALAFSEDTLMGRDSVIECVFKTTGSQMLVRTSWNEDGAKRNVLEEEADSGISNAYGFYSGGRVRCRFDRVVSAKSSQARIFDLTNSYHFIVGTGKADSDGNKEMHSLEPYKFPLVSPKRINVKDHVDVHGRARYPMVKAHGILMIIAWMMCGGLAVLMARYYRRMWPNDRFCGQRIWFSVHRCCLIIAVVCVIIAFIIIFIHVGGYSQLKDLPPKAHPPLGITVTILVILLPLIGLCRPSSKARHRPIFNWFYWLFGTVAFCLAAPTVFIGLSMYKAFVPWWATWVACAFMLFHVIIELLLEIHGCINGHKQKRRDREYNMTKQTRGDLDGYEPDPVGNRFKTTLISIYVVVMIICSLIMIITLAVC